MKRTNPPRNRQSIKKQDIVLDIHERDGGLVVEMKLNNLEDYGFPPDANIFLEAYSRLNIQDIPLGKVGSFSGKVERDLENLSSFGISSISKINFRLKVVDMDTYDLLGLAERLKERKYTAESLLPTAYRNISSIFAVEWDDHYPVVLQVNEKLGQNPENRERIKPIIVEAVFREILLTLLLDDKNDIDLENHEWIELAHRYNPDEIPKETEIGERKEWIEKALNGFSDKTNTVGNLVKQMGEVS